jgi:hypothetical protein
MRDTAGYATTYQSLAAALPLGNDNPHLITFCNKRMGLFIDEGQHCALTSVFHKAIEPLVQRAAFVIIASGRLSRHDKKMIAYLDYLSPDTKNRRLVDLSDSPERRVIRYGLGDATKERQLIEIKFELRDAGAAWEVEYDDGKVDEAGIKTFDNADPINTSRALFTALRTDFANDLLCEAGEFWINRRKTNSRSKFLVVCTSIVQANAACRLLRSRLGIAAEVAHSDDEAADDAILRFRGKKRPAIDVLVTVQMAYEGLDCPAADVLACLTHIRSSEWIEQCVHRVSRFDRDGPRWERQFATIFAPKDRFFRDIMTEMEEEQAPYIVETVVMPPGPPGPPKPTVYPLESEMGAASAYSFGGLPIDGNDHANLNSALRMAELYGDWPIDKAKRFFDAMSAAPPAAPQAEEEIKPHSERERDLKKAIEDYKRKDYNPSDPASVERFKRRAKVIRRMFNKKPEDLTIPQLQAVWNQRAVWFNV